MCLSKKGLNKNILKNIMITYLFCTDINIIAAAVVI